MIIRRCAILVFVAALASPASLFAQDEAPRFERVSLEEGLSQSRVNAILQDRKGFLWFGTQDGLNRYDGYRFTIYRHDPDDPQSLSNNRVRVLYEDPDGTLWVGTDGGLDRFDRVREAFTHHQYDPGDPQSLSHNEIRAFYTDPDEPGILWVGTRGGGLNRFDRTAGTFTRFQHDSNDPQSLSHNQVWDIAEDTQGALWIGTDGGGLNKFDRATETFTAYRHDPADPWSLNHDDVWALYTDTSGTLWAGTDAGLARFDPVQEVFARFQHDPANSQSLSDDFVRTIFEDRGGRLWIGTRGGGLNRFDGTREAFTRLRHNPNNPQSLSSNNVRTLFEDQTGILWIGTDGGGLSKYDPARHVFEHYRYDPASPQSLSNSYVRSVLEDRDGILWVGTNLGLNKLDRTTGTFVHYEYDETRPQSLSNNEVRALFEDRGGTLWVGTNLGLNKMDRVAGTFTHYRHRGGHSQSLSNNEVRAILEDRDGALWVGTNRGLNKMDRATETFTRYLNDPAIPQSLYHDEINTLLIDRAGVLWIGSDNGLSVYDPDTDTFTHYLHDAQVPQSINGNEILALYEDASGTLWIGADRGLNRFDRTQQTFTSYEVKDGLPHALVKRIHEDDDGFLWLSTNRGLSKFDPRTEVFRNYNLYDGLQSNEFNPGASFKNSRGELFFGGVNGLNAFHPDLLQFNTHAPPLALTDFKLFNEPTSLDTAISEIRRIDLTHKDDVVTFDFAALDFRAPAQNRFAYKLDGFHEDWIDLGTKHDVTFTDLDPGSYTLYLRGANSSGVWNEAGIELGIRVTPPFWATWWFRMLGLMGIAGLLLTAYQMRTRRIRAHNRALHAEIAERKQIEEALHLTQFTVDTAGDSIFWLRPDGGLVYVNDRACRSLGYTRDELLAMNVDDISAQTTRTTWSDLWDTVKAKGSLTFETIQQTKDGREIPVEITANYLWHAGKAVQCAFVRDVTERKQVEAERETFVHELEAKNAELERFTYTVSHDLKSPLVTIKGFLGLLERDAARGNIERMRADMERIAAATDKMQRLLAELLELSRIGRQVNSPEEIPLRELIYDVQKQVAGPLGERRVVVELAPDLPLVFGDRVRLLEVFQNLIENAVKYMGDQPTPRIEIGAEQQNGTVQCFVRDNGIGIEPRFHEKVFGLFERLDTATEGSGIGLALVKRIVEVHGGRIWIESEGVGQGSTFHFTLPPTP